MACDCKPTPLCCDQIESEAFHSLKEMINESDFWSFLVWWLHSAIFQVWLCVSLKSRQTDQIPAPPLLLPPTIFHSTDSGRVSNRKRFGRNSGPTCPWARDVEGEREGEREETLKICENIFCLVEIVEGSASLWGERAGVSHFIFKSFPFKQTEHQTDPRFLFFKPHLVSVCWFSSFEQHLTDVSVHTLFDLFTG